MFLGVKTLIAKVKNSDVSSGCPGESDDIGARKVSESATGIILSRFQKFKTLRHPNIGLYIDALRGRNGRIFLISEHNPRTLAAYVEDKLQASVSSMQHTILGRSCNQVASDAWCRECVWLGENLPFRDGNESSASLFEENFVLHICRDAASGLDFLHSRGLRHLGLNLECILLFSDRIVIVDHAIHDVTSGGHHIDAIICSPDFSSPEILLEPLFGSRIAATPSSDAWSLGAILLYLLRDANLPWLKSSKASGNFSSEDEISQVIEGVLQFAGVLPPSTHEWLFAPPSHHTSTIVARPDRIESFMAAYLPRGCCYGLAVMVHLLLDPQPANRPPMLSVLENPLFSRLEHKNVLSSPDISTTGEGAIPQMLCADVLVGPTLRPACADDTPQRCNESGGAAAASGVSGAGNTGREGAWGYLSDVVDQWVADGGDVRRLAARHGGALQPPRVLRGMVEGPGVPARRREAALTAGAAQGQRDSELYDRRIHCVPVRHLLPSSAAAARRREPTAEAPAVGPAAGARRPSRAAAGEADADDAAAAASGRSSALADDVDTGWGPRSWEGGGDGPRCGPGAGDVTATGGGHVIGDGMGGGGSRGAAVRGLLEAIRSKGNVAERQEMVRDVRERRRERGGERRQETAKDGVKGATTLRGARRAASGRSSQPVPGARQARLLPVLGAVLGPRCRSRCKHLTMVLPDHYLGRGAGAAAGRHVSGGMGRVSNA
jgi:serine/threonine protein kinase